MTKNARTFAEYPEGYFKILDHFAATGQRLEVPGNRREIFSLRRDLYRFFRTLNEAYTTDPYAASLSDAAKEVILRIEPSKGDPTTPSKLIVEKRLTIDINLFDDNVETSTDGEQDGEPNV